MFIEGVVPDYKDSLPYKSDTGTASKIPTFAEGGVSAFIATRVGTTC
jgi:hypothetical protein